MRGPPVRADGGGGTAAPADGWSLTVPTVTQNTITVEVRCAPPEQQQQQRGAQPAAGPAPVGAAAPAQPAALPAAAAAGAAGPIAEPALGAAVPDAEIRLWRCRGSQPVLTAAAAVHRPSGQGENSVRNVFAGLFPGTQWRVELLRQGAKPCALQLRLPPPELDVPDLDPRDYVSRGHPIGAVARVSHNDYLWSRPDLADDDAFLYDLFMEAVFYLPSGCVAQLPNPRHRFCIDLAKEVNWARSRRVRKAVKCGRWRMRCATDRASVARGLRIAAEVHSELYGVTWLTPSYISTIARQAADPHAPVRHLVVELWDTTTDALVAVICSFCRGRCFHDYTHATVQRDSERLGTLLTKVTGHLLRRCGYELWYWGLRDPGGSTEYMGDFVPYGGSDWPRAEFCPKWHSLLQQTPKQLPWDAIEQGSALLQPLSAQRTPAAAAPPFADVAPAPS
eukprot:TRINITY_DN19355_c0_g1_i1.p1 TRINITY_DN19355_c0_g1~~TRINITY_DN19355_c0_g1_i1.p1  ORF type:complete len:470 (+),score=100.87 TRINITY_DN19355_c0_g1_i1:62-1411(+)